MEEERNLGAPNLQIFPISSTPFAHRFLVGGIREIQKTFASNVENCVKMVDGMRSQNEIVDKVLSFPAYLHSCFQLQIPRRNLSSHNFAAILPGDSVAGVVVASGLSNFLNIYNTLLIVRLVLTWFPNAPPAVVSPLSTLCDPYLNIFRGLIPPLGGLDLSPVLAFLVLNAFTSTAAALPAELPPPTTLQEKWMARLAKMSNTHKK
ncbi:hypothetical protein SASPL_121890 [Salvia splendens]|uniref:YggT family protein n=1 Tax=Salvia splendens TaxID=180675 RepID=A0A8X8XJ38_SALSN|nr:ylmG homolog protein 2, chloroplastic-like [Salvia splendens]KAG6414518.1 hypothetical protein SASPL_121890 [Salvia splendens]